MASQTYETGGLGDFFKRWRNGDLLERHRRNKVAAYFEKLAPLVDPEGRLGDLSQNRTFNTSALKYIAQKISPKDFERSMKAQLKRFQPVSEAEVDAAVSQMRRPALMLSKMPTPNAKGAEGCWLGGMPNLPADIAWPWHAHGGVDLVPMHFLAQINLAHLPRDPAFPQMPQSGSLLFFYTQVAYHFAYNADPLAMCRVIYVEGDASRHPQQRMPEIPDVSTFEGAQDWEDFAGQMTKGPLARWNIDFVQFDDINVPNAQQNANLWKAGLDAVLETYDSLQAQSAKRVQQATANDDEGGTYAPLHQIFGCQNGGNAGSDNLLLALEMDADLSLADEYIQGIQLYFDSTEARDAFDLSKVRIDVESS